MLKPRIIAVLIVRAGWVVQSLGFRRYLPVGRPEIAVHHLDRWGIDEIVVLCTDAPDGAPDYELMARLSRVGRVPLTYAGGVTEVDQMERLLKVGADKIAINAALHDSPDLIRRGSERFGVQCMVASVDAARHGEAYAVRTNNATRDTGKETLDFCGTLQEAGAGEILLQSVDRDGARTGYDADLCRPVLAQAGIPVILCGGVGHPQHLAEGISWGAAAVAAGNFWHYTEQSVIVAKRWLVESDVSVRLDTHATYADFAHDSQGRAAKRDDSDLETLRFTYVPEEVI